MHRTRRTILGFLLLAVVFIVTSGSSCSGFGRDAAEELARVVDRTTARIANESQQWRTAVKELEEQLAKDTRDIAKDVARQVSDISQRTIATAGTEIRCDIDFVRDRVRTQLGNIARRLRKLPEIAVAPVLCQVVPTHVDLRLKPDQVGVLEMYGYDLPTGPLDRFQSAHPGREQYREGRYC
jgi:hypothetical protein